MIQNPITDLVPVRLTKNSGVFLEKAPIFLKTVKFFIWFQSCTCPETLATFYYTFVADRMRN